MQLLPVYHHDKLCQENLWAIICNEVVKPLDKQEIQLTSIDLTHFRWEERNMDGSNGAFKSSKDVLQLLERHNIYDIDIVYHESVVKPLTASSPKLFTLVKNLHPLKDVIDPVTTTDKAPTI
ncbi:hypothetical protein EDB85DRAFT_2137771 [Lactarius pseudohatsudake]|nr:hypothetical protein EDB85DRAFT_2137771 [Lactarius pseudohatsudake]